MVPLQGTHLGGRVARQHFPPPPTEVLKQPTPFLTTPSVTPKNTQSPPRGAPEVIINFQKSESVFESQSVTLATQPRMPKTRGLAIFRKICGTFGTELSQTISNQLRANSSVPILLCRAFSAPPPPDRGPWGMPTPHCMRTAWHCA